MKSIQSVLFDLDGTLIDTANDLGLALNSLLREHALPILSLEQIRPEAGRGSKGLIKLGFDIEESDLRYTTLCENLLNYYETYLLNTTALFHGMEEVLLYLEKKQIPWGIVTNKPEKFTYEILRGLQLTERAGCIISGDTLQNRKPHPQPLLHACEQLKQNPENCLYIGDSETDVIASKAAGLNSLVALYGYIPKIEDPKTWRADGYIQHPLEIMQWMQN